MSKYTLEVRLDDDFQETLEHLTEKYGDEMLKLSGLSKSQLDVTEFYKKFLDDNDSIADISTDDNANIHRKNINIMKSEAMKPFNRLLSKNKIFIEMKEKFGLETAKQLFEKMLIGSLHEHDDYCSSTLPYCYAFSLYPIYEKGLFFIEDMKSTEPKHLDTFNNFVLEFVSDATDNIAGACGLPDYLVYAYYFYKKDCESGHYTDVEWFRNQQFQKILYELNQPYLKGGEQSAYTNFSILDREHLFAFFGDLTFSDGVDFIDCIDDFLVFQNQFMEFSAQLREIKHYTFPVITGSVVFNRETGEYVDKVVSRQIIKHNWELGFNDINMLQPEEVVGVSSCCFEGTQKVMIRENGISHILNIGDVQNVAKDCYNVEVMGSRKSFVKARLVRQPINNHKMYKVITEDNRELYVTDNHIHLIKSDKDDEDSKECITTDLVVGDELLLDFSGRNTKFDVIKSIEEYKSIYDFVFCFQILDKEEPPYFTLENGIITHNCRVINEVGVLNGGKPLEGNFNSIGGSSLSIGSTKVMTINLVHLALESKNQEEFVEKLKDMVSISHKYHYAQRNCLKKLIKKGALPMYTYNLMSLDRQFATIGITGVYEATKIMGGINHTPSGYAYSDDGLAMAQQWLSIISEMNKSTFEEYGYTSNVEQIPAESASIKLRNRDRLFFGSTYFDEKLPHTKLYGNQWIPLSVDASVLDRLKAAILDKYCGGGAILHINLGERFNTLEDAVDYCKFIASFGVIYFSFISKINLCPNDHSFFSDFCPICDLEASDQSIKVVGYIVKRSHIKSERAVEMDNRIFYDLSTNTRYTK